MSRSRAKGRKKSAKQSPIAILAAAVAPAVTAPTPPKAKGKKGKASVLASLPADLCAWSDVMVGFSSLEPIASLSDTLLIGTDAAAAPKSLAAESLAHLAEGWRYLSAAASASLTNAHPQAIHFAYYAELRAALSLFASTGIRIAKPQHQYLNATGTPTTPAWVKRPTHDAVWEIWKGWISSPSADQLFTEKLRIHPSVTLKDVATCLSSFSVKKSLEVWGFDLVNLDSDHLARNVASYQPALARAPLDTMKAEDVEFFSFLWQQLQPAVAGMQFEINFVHFLIDLQLVELRAQAGFDEEKWYIDLCTKLAQQTGASTGDLLPLLKDRSFSTKLFEYAGEQKTEWKNVLSRSLFLLRLASKSVEVAFSFHQKSSGKDWFRFWLEHAGLYSPKSGISLEDIWEDYSDLPSVGLPTGSPDNNFQSDLSKLNLAMRLSRPDASLAWSLGA